MVYLLNLAEPLDLLESWVVELFGDVKMDPKLGQLWRQKVLFGKEVNYIA